MESGITRSERWRFTCSDLRFFLVDNSPFNFCAEGVILHF